MLAYTAMTVLGLATVALTALHYERSLDKELAAAILAGVVGVVVGQLVALLRVRPWVVLLLCGGTGFLGTWLVASSNVDIPSALGIAAVSFLIAVPCGTMALAHHGELFAAFWPSVGWIGAVFTILNNEGRVVVWERDKAAAWLPLPLVYLFCFIVLWLLYLASKQAMRVELWQSLSGAAARRIQKRAAVAAVPKKNLGALIAVAILVFGATALLAPYLWRTGRGRDSDGTADFDPEPELTSPIDGDRLLHELLMAAQKLAETARILWPLLLLFLAYRPVKRWLLLRHLRKPFVPLTPSERIANGWEYVRIAAGDVGFEHRGSDSIEDLVDRLRGQGLGSDALDEAARIYTRTRYGLAVAMGDPEAMRESATHAAREIQKNLGLWARFRNLWRPLE